MFGWRKRRDGFEWRDYVRTTILVRRERRRQRIDELREAALDNLKEAGRKSADVGAARLGSANKQVRRGFGAAFAASGVALRSLAGGVRPAIARIGRPLGGGVAPLLAGSRRAADRLRVFAGSWHLDSGTAQVALLLGAVIAGTSLASWWSNRDAAPQTASLAETGSIAAPPAAPSQVSGRATATSGDSLRIGRTNLRLAGIQAPDRGQSCTRGNGKRWDCGQAAAQALTRHVRGHKVECNLSGQDGSGTPLATCRIGDDDVAAALVTAGHVFAETGLFAAYSGLEAKAREDHAGMWAGEAERPAEYRARRWEDAKKASPDGCPIKAHVASGSRVYLLPWSPNYERAKVRSGRGERWFCSEKEALAAGWKADPHTPRGS